MLSPGDSVMITPTEAARQAGMEPIPGYRLVKPLGRGGFGDVWKCVAPGGIAKAVKFVSAEADHIVTGRAPADQELAALQRFRDIRHPFLLSLDRIELVGEELVIVMELADGSLDELKAAHQDRGFPGIPREELLGLLREAADALDFISQVHQLQHLDIKPQNLLLVSRHIKIADFGLVQSLQEGAADVAASASLLGTPVYAAPETFEGRFSKHSDQYSLAIVYMELLTGVRPFTGKNARQLMLQHLMSEPELAALPEQDRPAIKRSLAKDPRERFPSCVALLQALSGQPASSAVNLSLPEFDIGAAETPKSETPTPSKRPHDTASAIPDLGRITDAACDELIHADQQTPGGLEFIEYLGQNRLAEVWRARAPDGTKRMARRLNHTDRIDPLRLKRIQEFRHPHVLPVEAMQDAAGRWYLVSPDYQQTLRDRLLECRDDGLNGIPRQELIDSLKHIAAALDMARFEHGLTHLGLNPRRVVIHEDRIQVADLGLIQAFWETLGRDSRHGGGRYDAPELLDGNPGPASDQYSLALLYAELLTGGHPRNNSRGRNPRSATGFDLDGMTTFDRAVIQTALHADPKRRYASCEEFMAALEQAHQPPKVTQPTVTTVAPAVWAEALEGKAEQRDYPTPPAKDLQIALLRSVTGGVTPCEGPGCRYALHPDGHVEHRFQVQLFRGGLHLRLQGFADQWRALTIYQDERSAEYLLRINRTLLQRCLGQQPGLRMRVEVEPLSPELFQGRICVATLDRSPEEMRVLLTQAPRLLGSLRAFMQAKPEQRAEERWPCVRPVRFYPVHSDLRIGRVIEGKTFDLGSRGIGLTLSQMPPSERGYILIPGEGPLAECALLARIVRTRPAQEGGYAIGARFVGEEPPV